MKEPIIHSHITDKLPEGHSLAYEEVNCLICNDLVHCGSNECMRTWVETGVGNFCLKCFMLMDKEGNHEGLETKYALDKEETNNVRLPFRDHYGRKHLLEKVKDLRVIPILSPDEIAQISFLTEGFVVFNNTTYEFWFFIYNAWKPQGIESNNLIIATFRFMIENSMRLEKDLGVEEKVYPKHKLKDIRGEA